MYQFEKLQLTSSKTDSIEKTDKIISKLKCLELNQERLDRIKKVFETEMQLALNYEPSSLQMENTYIPELITGEECGTFLAMDLGGTKLRVMLLVLDNGKVTDEILELFPIKDELRIGCGFALFDFLAECIDTFLINNKLSDDKIYPLGFTFSFPMRQSALNSARLVTWTKSFNCPSVLDEDVVKILNDSLLRRNRRNVVISAILNDTTGTLMHGAYLDKQTRIGIVLGTGSNGCYMENANRVKHWEQERHGEKHVLIDVEWGAFGDNGVLDFIKTDYDRAVDNGSLLKNSFTFEKYISGKYLGELCRVILESLHKDGLFLKDKIEIQDFPKPWTFDSGNVALIENETIKGSFELVKDLVATQFHINEVDLDDLYVLRYVCGIISLRAAKLLATTTSSLLNRMDETDVTIAVDGSVYKHHLRLKYWFETYTAKWAPKKMIKFMLAEDGSGKGAALVASIADRIQKRLNEQ